MPKLVEKTLNGQNSTVCAYGNTGSGKTYTMMGPNKQVSNGLIFKTVTYLLQELDQLNGNSQTY